MAPQDSVGRIHRDDFVISTSVLLGLCVVAVAIRFVIRLHVQKVKFAADDGVLLVALCTLICSFVVVYTQVLDRMYLIIGLQAGLVIPPPADWMQISFQFHKWVTVSNMLGWTAVMTIKLSFMLFFKKLIDRLPVLNYYWWVLMAYQLGCFGYGLAVYYVGCPYYFDPRELECASGPYKKVLIHDATAQLVLDLVGDGLILVMPIAVIWQIRVQWSQKVALMASLCLTIFMMISTIARVAGLIYNGAVDSIWETYWTLISAEVGVFLAAATAFRTFFVTRNNSKAYTPRQESKRFFAPSFVAKFQRKKKSDLDETLDTQQGYGLPNVPRGQITGMRTFIDRQGKSQHTQTTSMSSTVYDHTDGDLVPLHTSENYKK
ncbi:hypothetical protein K504DRAFT_476355 [Pleomassaria siparia CBS 279.74]|uniref:Rhodopsin domain-containing protein n=1 Tax=Pleomassaria siparia CBS 279.74 TaxID=1314801 RepID=A0A6G1KBY5_9PLEO|nr:hypothetical protein K504DRAFT_476355 [Pleomassaria siparia CBS 279.74]